MPAITVIQDLSSFFNMPGIEAIDGEVSDGETYESRKFSIILGGGILLNTDADINYQMTFSGKTATMRISSGADRRVTIVLFGRK